MRTPSTGRAATGRDSWRERSATISRSQLIGGDIILTIPPAWQRLLNASGIEVRPRIDEPVDDAILRELLDAIPDFRRAYEPDGLAPDELEGYGAAVRTLRQFIAAYRDLQAHVRDAVLPDPA